MANITQYNAPISAPEPTDRAANTAREAGTVENIFAREEGQALGGAISRVGGQIGEQIDRHNTAMEIGHGSAAFSSKYSGLTQAWNDLASKSDPNDTSIAQGFKEKVLEPSIDEFLKGFEGATQKAQDWAQSRADQLRQHFSVKIGADMGTRAAAAVRQNLGEMEKHFSDAATNDPTSLPFLSDTIKTDVDALVASHQLDAGDAARVKAEIVPKMQQSIARSAFAGMAERNPAEAIKSIDRGDFNDYADKQTQVTWRKYAEQQQRVQNQDAKQDALAAKQEARQNSADKSEEYRMQMYDVNSGRILRTNPKLNQQILQDTTILPADKTALIRWNETQYQAQLREDKQTADGLPSISNQKILSDMRDRVGSTTDPTTRQEVVDATSAGMLTSKDAHDMMWRVGQSDKAWQAVQRPFTDQFRDFKHTMLTSMTSTLKYLPPEAQMQKLNDIESDAQRLLRDAYQKRDTPLIRQMLDKNSPQWVLRTAAQSLSSSPSSSIQQQADEMRRQEKINQIPGAESQATSNPIKDALERAKQPYEPDKFEYQIINGQIMKRRIGAAGG